MRRPFDINSYPSSSFENALANLEAIIQHLEALEITVPNSSRLWLYHRSVEKFISKAKRKIPPSEIVLARMHQALLEIDQLNLILSALPDDDRINQWIPKLKLLVAGQVFPQLELKRSPSRDIQFELYTAAHCSLAGYQVSLNEPDMIVVDPLITFGIAAKRPKSTKKLERRIRLGGKQILRTGLDGILAIDLTLIYNRENMIMHLSNDQDPLTFLKDMADKFILQNTPRVIKILNSVTVFGLMVYVSSRYFVYDTLQLGTAYRWTSTCLCDEDDPRYDIMINFTKRFAESKTKSDLANS